MSLPPERVRRLLEQVCDDTGTSSHESSGHAGCAGTEEAEQELARLREELERLKR